MYQKIYEFCKVRNEGNCFYNGSNPTPRVEYIINLCKKAGFSYELDVWEKRKTKREYTILDFPDLYQSISDDKIEAAEEVYNNFNSEGRKFLVDQGIDSYPEDLIPEEMDALGDEYLEIFDRYDKELHDILGEMGASNQPQNNFYNIMLMGSSDKFVVAHHDIVNPDSDNANDNSCSVINALAIKSLRPDINVVILDGEELGGIGSTRLSDRIKSGEFPCKWILNLELTGSGGKNFFVGSMGTPLTDAIAEMFQCPIVKVPFNDSVIFKKYGIDSTVINPLPITNKQTPIVDKDGNYLDMGLLYNCHSMKDSLDTISTRDMEEFVNEVCLKIIDQL